MTSSVGPSFEALYNRYRPQRFGQVVGQLHVVRILQNALAHNRMSHAYLFSGERGTGKTTAARLLAKAVNCLEGIQPEPCGICEHCRAIANNTFVDLMELDAASHSSVDDVRELREQTQFAPATGRHKVYIIDEVHQLSAAAKDALLKTLEEPPVRTLFVLATTEAHRVPATIRSRCQHLTFRRLGDAELISQLRKVADAEGASIEQPALSLLARNAGGSMRDAISLLDQTLAFAEGPTTVGDVNAMLGLVGRKAVVDIAGALADGDASAGLNSIELAVADGNSPSTLRSQVIDLLRETLLVSAGAADRRTAQLDDPDVSALAERFGMKKVVRVLEVFAEPEVSLRGASDPVLELELVFARAVLGVHGDDVVDPTRSKAVGNDATSPAEGAPVANAGSSQIPQDDLTVSAIASRSHEWLSAVRGISPVLAPYVEQGEVLGVADGVVTIGYRSQLLFERMERPDAGQLVEQVFTDIFGRPLRVRNQLQQGVTQPRRAPAGAAQSGDPVVRVAMREYGAQLVNDDEGQGG